MTATVLEVRAHGFQVDFLVAGVPLVVERALLALVMIEHADCAALAVARDVHAFGAKAPLDAQVLVLAAHKVDNITAEEHLVFSEYILEELLWCNHALVLEEVDLQCQTQNVTYQDEDNRLEELKVVQMNGVTVNTVFI